MSVLGRSKALMTLVMSGFLLSGCTNMQTRSQRVASQCPADKTRSLSCIQVVFDLSQRDYFSAYVQALRLNPALTGKLVLSITIDGSGLVTEAHIVSSDMNDAAFENRVLALTRQLKFVPSTVTSFTYPNYPFRFLPPS